MIQTVGIPTNMQPAPIFPAGFVNRYATEDFDAMAGLSPAWGQVYRKVRPGPFQSWANLAHTAHLQSREQYFKPGIAIAGRTPRNCWSFALPLTSGEGRRIRGMAGADDELWVTRDGEDIACVSTEPLCWLVVSVARARLEAHAEACGCALLAGQATPGRLMLGQGRAARLARDWRRLNGLILNRPELLTDPAHAWRIEQAFLSAVARQVTPNVPRRRPPQRNQIARSACGYLHGQCHRPVSTAELCKAVGVPERTLHLAFQEAYGMPPGHYMKLQRLNGAHQALLQGGASTTVSRIAMDWGFSHLGRFAADYQALFDVTPSETLLRAQHAGTARAGVGRHGAHRAVAQPQSA